MTFTDPSYGIQAAVIGALKASSALSAIVSDRIFDRINASFKPPYVNVSDASVIPELADETDAAESSVTVHGWSEKVGFAEIYKMGAAITSALHDVELVVSGKQVQSILLESARYLRDPDGITSHGVFTFTILTDAS